MNCQEYSNLTVIEQYQLIGKLCHIAQNHSEYFAKAQQMIKQAEKRGLLVNVKINPSTTPPPLTGTEPIYNETK